MPGDKTRERRRGSVKGALCTPRDDHRRIRLDRPCQPSRVRNSCPLERSALPNRRKRMPNGWLANGFPAELASRPAADVLLQGLAGFVGIRPARGRRPLCVSAVDADRHVAREDRGEPSDKDQDEGSGAPAFRRQTARKSLLAELARRIESTVSLRLRATASSRIYRPISCICNTYVRRFFGP